MLCLYLKNKKGPINKMVKNLPDPNRRRQSHFGLSLNPTITYTVFAQKKANFFMYYMRNEPILLNPKTLKKNFKNSKRTQLY
jgi:hypothetical protein